MSGRKSGIAARNRAANTLTHAAKTVSLPNGSGCVFFALVVTPRRFPALHPADREVSVLPSTLEQLSDASVENEEAFGPDAAWWCCIAIRRERAHPPCGEAGFSAGDGRPAPV